MRAFLPPLIALPLLTLVGCGSGENPGCKELGQRCNGAVIEACQDGRFEPQTDCSQSGSQCVLDSGSGVARCIGGPACQEGQTRCTGDRVENCQSNSWILDQDCAASGKRCQVDPSSGQATCREPPCADGNRRCSGNLLQECSGGNWGLVEDCASRGRECRLGPVSGSYRCLGLSWVHLPVTIQDPVVNGTSLMMPVDNPTFGFDPARDLFVTSFDRDYNDPSITFLWGYEGATGIHRKSFLSGQVFPAAENFCMGGENWCQFISFDPNGGEWVVVGVSTTALMRVAAGGTATLTAVTGTHPPDNWIGHVHRFDWTLRKLFLYGAVGPSSFSSTVYELDLDTGVWRPAVTGLTQVVDNCLVADAGTGLLYSFGGDETTDGGNTTRTLSTYRVIDLGSGQSSTQDLPAAVGPRMAINCAFDPDRGLIYLLGGAVVRDNWNEILNEYHNDLWVFRPSDGRFFPALPDGPLGTFLPPDSYGDRKFDANPDLPNFGKSRGLMAVDPDHHRLVVMGEVPIFFHAQPYTLDLEGVEELLW